MTNIYIFEWNYFIGDTDYVPVSYHTTKKAAFKAMMLYKNNAWLGETELYSRKMVPLQYEAGRIKTVQLL